jgi:hypothetical protein
LAPPAAAVVAQVPDLADLALPALPEVVVDPAVLAVLLQRAVPALPEVVVALAAEEEPEALVALLSRQSFSAAMARTTP